MTPTTLTRGQLAGLLKVGDLMVPGDNELPSFSDSGCAQHADRMIAHMNAGDRDGLTMLLGVFRFVPSILLRGLLRLTDRHRAFPEPIAAALRMVGVGVKGVVMTLYYSGIDEQRRILRAIKWDAKVVDRPVDDSPPPLAANASSAPKPKPAPEPITLAQAMQHARAGGVSLR